MSLSIVGNETYDGWNSKFVLLGVVEELQDIVTDDNTALAGEDVFSTHCVFVNWFWRYQQEVPSGKMKQKTRF